MDHYLMDTDDDSKVDISNPLHQTEETVLQVSSVELPDFNINMPSQKSSPALRTLSNEPGQRMIPSSEIDEEKIVTNVKELCNEPISFSNSENSSIFNSSLDIASDSEVRLSISNNTEKDATEEQSLPDNVKQNDETALNSNKNICLALEEEKTVEHNIIINNTVTEPQEDHSVFQDTICNEKTLGDKPVELATEPPAIPIPDTDMEFETRHGSIPQEPFDLKFSFSPTCSLRCGDTASSVFEKHGCENFLKGCKWSPDGTQVVTNSNDNILRTFTPLNHHNDATTHQMNPNCVMRESGLVYDYSWFPGKTDSYPDSCRVACSCPGSPIHLWDSNQGHIVSSYKAFDQCDEITHAYSLSFSSDGARIYGGYKKCIRIFDTEYSHRKCTVINTFDSKTHEGHKGIISCFCHGPPESRTFVTGSYSRHVGIYCSVSNQLVCLIQGQQGGVTHIMLSPDGHRLYTGGRKDPEIVCWDMRQPGHVLCTYLRDVQTNQRIYFDLSSSGRYLVSGNHDGSVQVWDTQEPGHDVAGEIIMKPCYTFQAHRDCVNGVSFNPEHAKLATASGQRHFGGVDTDSDSDDSGMSGDPRVKDFSLKIWSIPRIL